MNRIVITAAARTAITGWHRGQSDMTDDQLAATALSAIPVQPDLLLFGNTVGPGGNVARIAALGSGWESTGAVTLDAQCGSSLVAVGQAAAHANMTGQTVVAGGTESPSTAWPAGQRTQGAFTPQGFADPDMTHAADQLAINHNISRADQEAYAVRSHQRAMDHPSPYLVGGRNDDGPRHIQRLVGRMDPVTDQPFATVTGLTAARIVDAAAAVQLAPETTTENHLGVEVVDYRLVGADPALPGLAAAPAIEALLTAHQLTLDQIGVIDIVEAYAVQVLAVCQRLGLNPEHVNAHGGALAHGHPWAASGAIALLTTIEQLHNTPAGTYGITAAAIAGGMGAALLVRNL